MGLEGMDKILSESLAKRPGMRRQLQAELVLQSFSVECMDMIGERARGSFRPMHVRERVLTVACLSSACAAEIRMREAELCRRLNVRYGAGTVSRIRIMS